MDVQTWNQIIARLPQTHVLQTWEWGNTKAQYGWQPYYLVWQKAGEVLQVFDGKSKPAQGGGNQTLALSEAACAAGLVLQRTMPIRGLGARMRVCYVPKGPALNWEEIDLRRKVLRDLEAFARRQGAIFIKIEPDIVLGTGIPGSAEDQPYPQGTHITSDLADLGWHLSQDQIQFRNTVLIDLKPSEADLLADMKQKTRYNIRLAARKGVQVRTAEVADLPLLYRMYAETSLRDGFVIRDETYYQLVWSTFLKAGKAQALIAQVDGQPVAGLILFLFAGKAWYLYGMSRNQHREKMPTYLLQWEAMRLAKAAGCHTYDLWGAPDDFRETDPMWGVFRFKEGLGGQVVRTAGAWDLPVQKLLYYLYVQILPRWLDWLRQRGIRRTRQSIQPTGSFG